MYDGPEPTGWDRTVEFLKQLLVVLSHPWKIPAVIKGLRERDTE